MSRHVLAMLALPGPARPALSGAQTVTSVQFGTRTSPAAATTPEPAPVVLVLAGLALAAVAAHYRRER